MGHTHPRELLVIISNILPISRQVLKS